jgi:iron(II)-dependent oxidoreductase
MGTELADLTESAAVVEALEEARERTLALVATISDDDLAQVHSTLMSPLVWDLGHIAAFEDLWLVHRFGGRPLLRDDLADVYDAFETPRAGRGELPFLRPKAAREYLREVRARTLETIEERGTSDVHEMVIRHEHQHNETMLQTIQLARLDGYVPPRGTVRYGPPRGTVRYSPPRGTVRHSPSRGTVRYGSLGGTVPYGLVGGASGLDFIEIPGGPCTVGAPEIGFAYDNERPRHRTDVRGYLIGRTPITNGSYLTFVEGGGYERREWWSDEGWAWKEQYDITRPAAWTAELDAEWRLHGFVPLDPHRPVVHVSWFEADAFARAHDARLPTETEWEKAATWNHETQAARAYPWGNEPPIAGVHANVDLTGTGPDRADGHPAGISPYGCHGMLGDVWEWTATAFDGYPGFTAYPYPEYSEVFFGHGYKVLKGGSWATRARVITPTFRNWDYPQRRQIFAGFRIARDMT